LCINQKFNRYGSYRSLILFIFIGNLVFFEQQSFSFDHFCMNFKSILIKDTSKRKKFWKTERTFEDFTKNRFKQPPKISMKGVFKKYSKNQQTFGSFKFFLVGSYFGYYKVSCFPHILPQTLTFPFSGKQPRSQVL